jgi:deoxycytidylate deaminase
MSIHITPTENSVIIEIETVQQFGGVVLDRNTGEPFSDETDVENAFNIHEFQADEASEGCLIENCGRPHPSKPGGDIHQTRHWLMNFKRAQEAALEMQKLDHQRALDKLRIVHAEETATIRVRLRNALWDDASSVAEEFPVPELARMVDNRIIILSGELKSAHRGIGEGLPSIQEAVALLEGVVDGGLSAQTRQRVLMLLRAAISDLSAGKAGV